MRDGVPGVVDGDEKEKERGAADAEQSFPGMR